MLPLLVGLLKFTISFKSQLLATVIPLSARRNDGTRTITVYHHDAMYSVPRALLVRICFMKEAFAIYVYTCATMPADFESHRIAHHQRFTIDDKIIRIWARTSCIFFGIVVAGRWIKLCDVRLAQIYSQRTWLPEMMRLRGLRITTGSTDSCQKIRSRAEDIVRII